MKDKNIFTIGQGIQNVAAPLAIFCIPIHFLTVPLLYFVSPDTFFFRGGVGGCYIDYLALHWSSLSMGIYSDVSIKILSNK